VSSGCRDMGGLATMRSNALACKRLKPPSVPELDLQAMLHSRRCAALQRARPRSSRLPPTVRFGPLALDR